MAVEDEAGPALEIISCDVALEDMQMELFWEIEHNDREDDGNTNAWPLFRQMWEFLCSLSPLIVRAVHEEGECIAHEGHDDDDFMTVYKVIREIDRLLKWQINDSVKAREAVVLLYGRVCYLRKRIRVALRNPVGPQSSVEADETR